MVLVAALLLIAVPLQEGLAEPRRPAPGGEVVSAIFGQVIPNWNPGCGTPQLARQRIQFDVTLSATGRIIEGPTAVRPQDDIFWRAAADSARVALIRTAPFEVPPDYAGGTYRPTFDAVRACARAAAPEADED